MKRAVIYTRVSTDEQAMKGNSLCDQEEVLRKACAHDGVEIIDHVQDDGYSAKTFNRPNFQRFFRDLQENRIKVDCLYVVKWDRFSRNMENGFLMLRDLRKYGVDVKCLEETYDTSDPATVMLRAIKMAEPEMDNRRRAKNTQMGIRRTLKEGRYACGAAPVGYMWDRNGSKPIIKPSPMAHLVKEAFEIYSTGLYSIESVRKLLVEKGLNIGKTAFNHMLRNPIYIGKLVIPELGEEEVQLISAIHEPIILEDLFQKTQAVLKRIYEKNLSRVEKTNDKDELPLRGMLECPKCHSTWTGSGSKGNGGVYFYYHCQNGCKERGKAETLNQALIFYLKEFTILPEVATLYLTIMEDIFKTKEGDREQQHASLERSLKELEAKLLKIDEMYVNGDLESDSYRRLKLTTKEEVSRIQSSLAQLKATDTNFMKYCRWGQTLLTHLPTLYEKASTTVKKKILGSIFTGKLIFEDGKYRTTGLNEAVSLIWHFQQEFGHKKAEHLVISDKTFGNVPMTGLEPALYC